MQQCFIAQFAGILMIYTCSEFHIPGPWLFAVNWKSQFGFHESKTSRILTLWQQKGMKSSFCHIYNWDRCLCSLKNRAGNGHLLESRTSICNTPKKSRLSVSKQGKFRINCAGYRRSALNSKPNCVIMCCRSSSAEVFVEVTSLAIHIITKFHLVSFMVGMFI